MRTNTFIKKSFPVLLLSLLFLKGYAQDVHLTDPEFLQLAFVDFNDNKQLYSIDAVRKFSNDLRSSDGSNFFNAKWESGVVYFKNGQLYKNSPLQFDFVKNELHFRDNNKILTFAEPVQQFTLFDTANGGIKIALFRNGYPALGNLTSNTFYQVLSNGSNIQLLRNFTKQNVEILPYDSDSKKSYKVSEDWYVYDVKAKTLQLISPNVYSIIKALPAYTVKVEKLNNGRKRKILTEDEIVALMNELNK